MKHIPLLLSLLLLLAACGQPVQERTLAAENPRGTIVAGVMAGHGSDYKDQVLAALFDKLDRQYTIEVRNAGKGALPPADAYLLVDGLWAGGKGNGSMEKALDELPEGKVVLFITTGDAKSTYTANGVEAITAASKDARVDETAERLAERLKLILP